MNKKISTPIAIGVILILSVVLGVFTLWQCLETKKEFNVLEIKISEKEFCGGSLDSCDGKKIILDGEITEFTVWQHLGMGAPSGIEDYEKYEYSEFFDLDREYMQIILRSKERIDCKNKLKVQGTLKVIKIECSPGQVGKCPGRDYYLFIDKWECLDETAGWRTYRNEEYGFEFKYPNTWNVFKSLTSIFSLVTVPTPEIDSSEIFSVDEVENNFFSAKEDIAVFYLSYMREEEVEREKLRQNVEDALEAFRLKFKNNYEKFINLGEFRNWKWENAYTEEKKIGEVDVLKTYFIQKEYPNEDEIKEKTYFIYYILDKNSNGALQVTGIFQGKNQEEYISDFSQMISTFRFVEETCFKGKLEWTNHSDIQEIADEKLQEVITQQIIKELKECGYGSICDIKSFRVSGETVDLNNDEVLEYIIYPFNSCFTGTGGGPIYIFEFIQGEWKLIGDFWGAWARPIKSRWTKGYVNLVTQLNSGTCCHTIYEYVWSGETYELIKTVDWGEGTQNPLGPPEEYWELWEGQG